MQDHDQADRLYIITRDDLAIGLQAAQSAHAAFEFSHQHRLITTGWMAESNFIVLVTVPDLSALTEVVAAAIGHGLRLTLNYEPDVNDELTAVVLEPGPVAKRLCARMPLLGGAMVT